MCDISQNRCADNLRPYLSSRNSEDYSSPEKHPTQTPFTSLTDISQTLFFRFVIWDIQQTEFCERLVTHKKKTKWNLTKGF